MAVGIKITMNYFLILKRLNKVKVWRVKSKEWAHLYSSGGPGQLSLPNFLFSQQCLIQNLITKLKGGGHEKIKEDRGRKGGGKEKWR